MCQVEVRIENFLRSYCENKQLYCEFARMVLKKIEDALRERKMLYAYSSSREKTETSLATKLRRKVWDAEREGYFYKYNNPKEEITDLAGVRIVCYLTDDIKHIMNIVEKMFEVDWENSLDKADELSINRVGYLSVHYIVSLKEDSIPYEQERFKGLKCEIQLRTVLQDAWSQVFHDRHYKSNHADIEFPKEVERETNLIAGALELLDKEIANVVREYDRITNNRSNIDYQELLDSKVSKMNLRQYFGLNFTSVSPLFYNYNTIEKKLEKFGLDTLRKVDELFDNSFREQIEHSDIQLTMDKVLIYGMIFKDADKYFGENGAELEVLTQKGYNFLAKFIDIDAICKKYKIKMENNKENV